MTFACSRYMSCQTYLCLYIGISEVDYKMYNVCLYLHETMDKEAADPPVDKEAAETTKRHIHLKCQCAMQDISLLKKRANEDVELTDEVLTKMDELRSSMHELSNLGWKDGFQGGAVVMEFDECLDILKTQHKRLKCWVTDLTTVCAINVGEIDHMNTFHEPPYHLCSMNFE